MSECDDYKISLILQIVAVVLGTVSTIMLGVRCKCKTACGELNMRPRSSPLTPPDISAKPAESEKRPLIESKEECQSVIVNIKP